MIKSVRASANSSFALFAPQVGNPVTVGASVALNDPMMFTASKAGAVSLDGGDLRYRPSFDDVIEAPLIVEENTNYRVDATLGTVSPSPQTVQLWVVDGSGNTIGSAVLLSAGVLTGVVNFSTTAGMVAAEMRMGSANTNDAFTFSTLDIVRL